MFAREHRLFQLVAVCLLHVIELDVETVLNGGVTVDQRVVDQFSGQLVPGNIDVKFGMAVRVELRIGLSAEIAGL